jgi:ribosome-associated protein
MQTAQIVEFATNALNNLKAIDVITIDIRPLTIIADTLIICSGSSNTHVKSLAHNVIAEAKKQHLGFIKSEGEREGEWVIADLGDVVIHVMLQSARDFYNLEDLWEPAFEQRQYQHS